MTTEECIKMLREMLADATPLPWFVGAFHGDDEDTPRDAYIKMFDAGDQSVMYSVGSEHDSMREFLLAPAVTGNGTASQANAFLIAAAITSLPRLLDELERLERERDRLSTIVRVHGLDPAGTRKEGE